jgi:transcriptional regulator with XRE-family HTH domain
MELRIKELRKARGLTLEQLRGPTGLSRGYLSQLETGSREPSVETLQQIAAAFGVEVKDLFADSQGDQSSELLRLLDQLSPQEQEVLRTVAKGLIAQRPRADQESGSVE